MTAEATVADTRRLNSKPQDLTDAYGPPSNFLEIDVYDPQTIGVGRNRFTTYEVRMRVRWWRWREMDLKLKVLFGLKAASWLAERGLEFGLA